MAVVPVPAGQGGPVDLTKHPSGIVPVLQNIVSTVNLSCKLDLKKIALGARNAEYNPKRFAAVIMRIRDPKTTALIFASGKMVVTGAKSEVLARTAALKVCPHIPCFEGLSPSTCASHGVAGTPARRLKAAPADASLPPPLAAPIVRQDHLEARLRG